MQLIQIAAAPAGRREAQPGDEPKQQQENDQRSPIEFLHRRPL